MWSWLLWECRTRIYVRTLTLNDFSRAYYEVSREDHSKSQYDEGLAEQVMKR